MRGDARGMRTLRGREWWGGAEARGAADLREDGAQQRGREVPAKGEEGERALREAWMVKRSEMATWAAWG